MTELQHTPINGILLRSPQDQSFGMFVLIGLAFVLIGRVQELFPILSPLHLAIVFYLLSALAILKNSKNGRFQVFSMEAVEAKFLLKLWYVGLLSTVFSMYKMASLKFITMSFPVLMLLFFLTVNLIKTFADHRKAVWAIILIGIFLTLPSLSSSTLKWAASTASYDQNDTALLIIVIIPFAFYLMLQTGGIKKIFLLASLLILIYALFATGSRGGFVGLAAVLALRLYRSKTLNFIQKGGIILFCLILFAGLAPQSLKERLASVGSETDYNVTDPFGRKQLWMRNLSIIIHNPVLGVGPNCFDVANGIAFAEQLGGASWRMTAHNSFLLIAVEFGLTGLVFYVAFIERCMTRMRRLQKEAASNPALNEHIWFVNAMESAIVGFVVCAFFLSFSYKPILYFIIALGVAYDNILTAQGLTGKPLTAAPNDRM